MTRQIFTASLALLVFQSPVRAEEAGPKSSWTGEVSLTASNTTGNTETTDVGLGLKLQNESDRWRHEVTASADYGEGSGTKNKQRWQLGYQLGYGLGERTYIYGNADYFDDDFGAFVSGYFVGGGVGYKLVLPDPVSWSVEGGAGFRSEEDSLGDNADELAVRGSSDFDYAINENVSLYNNTEFVWSNRNTHIWSDVGVTAQLMGNLSARLSFRIDHRTDVPVNTENTDTALRGGVVYTIG
ncbi:MAG: DUF481 domain-containing protein [Hyphomonadaceae bacterium]|nr:DUF481 domain-containing protein [Hyphomonadaceae bacterium]MBC6411966.1 DUF481 domain-containing protein [Hyphomonadaceae bacterium]